MATNKIIKIKSNLPKKGEHDQLAVWEKDPRHPKGEILVSGDKVVEAFPTPKVVAALREERVVETDEPTSEETQRATMQTQTANAENKSDNQTAIATSAGNAGKAATAGNGTQSSAESDKTQGSNASGSENDESDADDNEGTALPEDFPHREILVKQGFDTVEKVKNATMSNLIALEDIGKARANDVFEAAKKL